MWTCCGAARKPDPAVAQHVANMLSAVAKPSLVADVLHRQNVPIATKDIYNIRQKLKFKGILLLSKVYCTHFNISCFLCCDFIV